MNYKERLRLAKEALESGSYDKDTIEYIFPELVESENEKIGKEIISYLKRRLKMDSSIPAAIDYWINWLEKQVEHAKFRDSIQIGDQVTKNQDGILVNLSQLKRFAKPAESKKHDVCDNCDQQGGCVSPCPMKLVEKQGEQKPVDKIKPKFHEGDLVVSDDKDVHEDYRVCKITKIDDGRYYIEDGGFISESSLAQYEYRLWTIQDAKDGDVLSYRDGQWIFIYKEKIDDNTFSYHTLYSTIHQDLTIDDAGFTLLGDTIIPATKEQRDLLFQKMKEAGYEWDTENKELKKIEQKSAKWDEEDSIMIDNILGTYKTLEDMLNLKTEQDKDILESMNFERAWIRTLKDRCIPQPKQEWSEEDEDYFDAIIAKLEVTQEDAALTDNQMDFLRSLKGKMQPKQEWSEEDEKRLSDIITFVSGYAVKEVNKEWVNFLKSLRPQNTWKPSDEQIREGLDKAASEWDSKAWFSPIAMVMDGDRPIGTEQHTTSHADSFKAGVEWVINKIKAL